MAAISDSDVSIDASGNIRWTGAATTNRHSILEFIQWLMGKQDDQQAAGDDLLDITVDTAFERSTDQIVTLNSPFNIDETFARHLYNGSVSQTNPTYGGEDLWSGLNVIGPVETGTEYMILQNGKVLPAFWGTGINPEAAPSLVFSRHLVKSKHAGAAIDGQRIIVLARELGDQYRRFPVTLGTANSVAAIGNGSDIFNETSDAAIGAWSTIVNTEGFQELNIDGTGASGQEFYSQWDVGSQTVNDTYERTKWISQRSHTADSTGGTPTGTNYVVENATILGQAQSFIPLAFVTEKLTEARFNIKIGGGTPTGTLYCELWDSDDAGSQSAVPTGGALARSADVLASAITSSYEEIIFRFDNYDPTDGSDQRAGLNLSNAEYFIVLRNDAGDGTNFFHVQGAATDQDSSMNRAEDTGSWAASSTSDLGLTVKSSPAIHGLPGEQFEGISFSCVYDNESGAGVPENTIAMWGTKVFYDTLVGGPFLPGEPVSFRNESGNALKTGGIVLYDDGTDELVVALDAPGSGVIDDNDLIEGLYSGATAAINVSGGAIEDEDLGGGTGIVLAKDDNGTTGDLYIQTITGVSPVDNSRIRASDLSGDPLTDFVDVNVTVTSRTLSPEFIGTSTGSNIIGAYGIGFDPNDVGSSDRFTSLDGATRQPPNNVAFTVSGLVAGEDRVLVGPRNGSALDRGMWLVNTALTNIATTALVVKTGSNTVPFPDAQENWPDTGKGADVSRLRVERDDGIYKRVPYDSHDGADTFTLGTGATGSIQIDVVAAAGTFTRGSGSFLTDGFENGARFTGANFANGGNNTAFTVDSVSADGLTITVVDNTGMVDETGTGDETLTINGWDFSDATEGVGPSGWDSSEAAVNNDVFLAFIDVLAGSTQESFTGVHGGVNRDLFVRVRDGGASPTKTFESTSAQFLSTPVTIAAIRTSDA